MTHQFMKKKVTKKKLPLAFEKPPGINGIFIDYIKVDVVSRSEK